MAVRAVRRFPRYWSEYRRYGAMPGAEQLAIEDATPALHDATGLHEIDAHYFFMNAWASRRITATARTRHVDVASLSALATFLSSVIRVVYVDYRPLAVALTNLSSVAANVTALPFHAGSVSSLSCLHVAEHVGLGRYGEPLDTRGTMRTAEELTRILSPGGNLFFALPIGRPRVCFNAHRIHTAQMIRHYFLSLTVREYSGVGDDGKFVEDVPLETFDNEEYACGMFWFQRPA